MIWRARVESVVEAGILGRESSVFLCGPESALLVRGSSATTHCHAAPAQLIRAYQSDDRRSSLTSAAPSSLALLDKDFHIRKMRPK
jgi:hypothetical protein